MVASKCLPPKFQRPAVVIRMRPEPMVAYRNRVSRFVPRAGILDGVDMPVRGDPVTPALVSLYGPMPDTGCNGFPDLAVPDVKGDVTPGSVRRPGDQLTDAALRIKGVDRIGGPQAQSKSFPSAFVLFIRIVIGARREKAARNQRLQIAAMKCSQSGLEMRWTGHVSTKEIRNLVAVSLSPSS